MSYRITNQIKTFVNDVMLDEERMESCRDGPKVSYMKCNNMLMERVIVNKIKGLLEKGAKQDDFFILLIHFFHSFYARTLLLIIVGLSRLKIQKKLTVTSRG